MSDLVIRPMKAGEEGAHENLLFQSYREYAGSDPQHFLAQRENYHCLGCDPRGKPEHTRLLFCGDELVSALTVFLWPIRFRAGVLLAGLVGGVCTHPDYRRRGHVRQLMEDAIAFMRGQAVTVSWLYGKQSVYGPSGYGAFTRYAVLEAHSLPPPEAGIRVRPLAPGRDLKEVQTLYETWNSRTFGPPLRMEEDWTRRILDRRVRHGGIAHYYAVEDAGGRMIAYCQILPDADRSIGEFGARDDACAARALAAAAQHTGGQLHFWFDHPGVERSLKSAKAAVSRAYVSHGMWRVIDGSRLGLPRGAGPAGLFRLLEADRFVYYQADHF